jgi:hypothetical protein
VVIGAEVNDPRSALGRIGGWSLVVGAAVSALSGYLLLAAGGFDPDTLLHPSRLLQGGASTPDLLRWAALTDMLGYYLLFAPLVVALGDRLRDRAGPLADLFTLGGLGYALIGATGAVVLAVAGSDLLNLHATSSGATRDAAAVGFRAVSEAVYHGVWATLEVIPLGLWAIGTGALLWTGQRTLGAVGVGLGLVCWSLSLISILGLLDRLGAWLLLLALPFGVLFWVYTLWLAILILRPTPGNILFRAATSAPRA